MSKLSSASHGGSVRSFRVPHAKPDDRFEGYYDGVIFHRYGAIRLYNRRNEHSFEGLYQGSSFKLGTRLEQEVVGNHSTEVSWSFPKEMGQGFVVMTTVPRRAFRG